MKSLIIYDSNFGNTKMIAETIAIELQGKAMSVNEIRSDSLQGVELLIVGSPINAWRPTEKIRKLLTSLSNNQLSGVRAAGFDTRIKSFISGNAAKKISRILEEKGAIIIMEPKGFYVKDKGGPMADGETEAAKNWAKQIGKKINS